MKTEASGYDKNSGNDEVSVKHEGYPFLRATGWLLFLYDNIIPHISAIGC